jgi:microcystin-dependent protein
MADPFLGELKLVAFPFAPKGWAQCDGQLLRIGQAQALFSLLGTMYGGDGQTTFALPDLRGRAPIHFARGWPQGTVAGEEAHTLTITETPSHSHQLQAVSADANSPIPTNDLLAGANNAYTPYASPTSIEPSSITYTGGSQPHENRHPYTVLIWCIALEGVFPSRD